MGPYTDIGNESGPCVLRSRSGYALGPGHNSIAISLDGQEYMVYHAWDDDMKSRRI